MDKYKIEFMPGMSEGYGTEQEAEQAADDGAVLQIMSANRDRSADEKQRILLLKVMMGLVVVMLITLFIIMFNYNVVRTDLYNCMVSNPLYGKI